jgi:hypothetical protein
MKTLVTVLIIFVPVLTFAQSRNYGVGIVLGTPTGFSGTLHMSEKAVVAIHAGWSLMENQRFHTTCTYQFMFPDAIRNAQGVAEKNLIPYLGIGGRLLFKDEAEETKVHLGVRIGGGIEYYVERFGFFLELFPVIDIVPKTEMDWEGGLGARFYF